MTLRLLLDTNAFIPLSPLRPSDIEEKSPDIAELAQLVSRLEGHLLLHPMGVQELARDRDTERREVRDLRIASFEQIPNPPSVSIVEGELGAAAPGTNDWVDNHLLAAVKGNAVHHLITEDDRVHRKARRLGLEPERVLRINTAVAYLRTLLNDPVDPPPDVRVRHVHELDRTDPIFNSLREDYRGFDGWLDKAAREQRRGWTIEPFGTLAGICLWKDDDDEYGLGGKVMKVSTFKVSDLHHGNRFGDLLLKALFQHLHEHSYDHAWLTVFPKHEELIALLEEFGFVTVPGRRTAQGELIMAKRLVFDSTGPRDSFEFHKRYGPPALDLQRSRVYVVPIQPRYHRVLFPDFETQASSSRQAMLPLPQQAFGNALRKAYLSRSGIRDLPRGSSLLFYRSDDMRAVTAVGVVESTLRSRDPAEIAQFTNLRTVYSFEQIRKLAAREVIAIRFRQDRLLSDPIPMRQLSEEGLLTAPPQTITRITDKEAIQWLSLAIGASR